MRVRFTVRAFVGSFVLAAICAALLFVGATQALAASPWWGIGQYSVPTNLPQGGRRHNHCDGD